MYKYIQAIDCRPEKGAGELKQPGVPRRSRGGKRRMSNDETESAACRRLTTDIEVTQFFVRKGLRENMLRIKVSENGPPAPAFARLFWENIFRAKGHKNYKTRPKTTFGNDKLLSTIGLDTKTGLVQCFAMCVPGASMERPGHRRVGPELRAPSSVPFAFSRLFTAFYAFLCGAGVFRQRTGGTEATKGRQGVGVNEARPAGTAGPTLQPVEGKMVKWRLRCGPAKIDFAEAVGYFCA